MMKNTIVFGCLIAIGLAKPNIESRVLNGKFALPGLLPWHVGVGSTDDYYPSCGGVFVDSNFVLTAAHCIHSDVNQYYLKLGVTNYKKEEGVKRNVTKSLVHPEFDPIWMHNDIALLYFKDAVEKTVFIETIPMNSNYIGGSVKAIVSGWGITENGDYPTVLKYADLTTLSQEECKKAHSFVHENVLCCIGEQGRSACFGDSGGPLIKIQAGEAPTLIGLVSFASAFGCDKGLPTGYTRIDAHYQWIMEGMEKLKEKDH